MSSDIFLCLVIISPWPIFYSCLLYCSKHDESFKFIIKTKVQLYKYVGILGLYIMFFSYIFFYRLLGITRIYNVYELAEKAKIWFFYIISINPPSALILLSLVGLFWIIYIFLQILWLKVYLKKLLLALYLYFYQYHLIAHRLDFRENWVKKYSTDLWLKLYKANNKSVLAKIVRYWFPSSIFTVERTLYRFLLPYLWVFDYMVNYGNISKMFKVLPWLYLHTLIKAFFTYLNKIHKIEHWVLSQNSYGHFRSIITGKRLGAGEFTRKATVKRFLEYYILRKKV